MDNNKEMIEGLVSQILDDYHDDKIINQQALFSQPDKEAVCDLLSKLIKICIRAILRARASDITTWTARLPFFWRISCTICASRWCLPCRRILNTGAYHITSSSICLRKSAMISLKGFQKSGFGGD
mgnify:FL=1